MVCLLRYVQIKKGEIMRLFRFLIVAGILIFACSTALADISVYFSPDDSYQAVGSSYKIDILADIPQNPGLVDFGFNLVWDESMMRLNDVSGTGSPWDILWDSTTPESITGFLFPTPTSPPSESGSGVLLAILDFTCLQEGSSTLGIGLDPTLVGLGLQGFYGPDGSSLNFEVTEGEVTQGVPEPGSIVLLSSVLAGLALWMKRK